MRLGLNYAFGKTSDDEILKICCDLRPDCSSSSMALFTKILGAPKGHKSGAGVHKSLNFSQVPLSNVQILFVYQFFYFYCKQRRTSLMSAVSM